MNNFGGDWTRAKIEILVEYAKAYLTIMNKHRYFKLMYFDGFAGTGSITEKGEDDEGNEIQIATTIGAARRIIELEEPRSFDVYYFVEKEPKKVKLLQENTQAQFPSKEIHVVEEDCNKKMVDMANFLRNPSNRNYRTLAFVDPCGMQVEWRSIECLRGLPIDMWILVPTGLGVNRLLKKNGEISDAWLDRLQKFLGMDRTSILSTFYRKTPTLFEGITTVSKEKDAVEKSATLYETRLKEVFDFVSRPYVLKNSSNSIMFHLFLTSNNNAGEKIANDIVRKYTS